MKNKKSLIIVILIIVLVSFGLLISPKLTNKYKRILNRIDSGETFNIILLTNENDEQKEILEYYKNIYGVKYEYLKIDKNDQYCKKLIKKIDENIDINLVESFFALVKKGKIFSYLGGYLSEESIRSYLIENNIINKKYYGIDSFVNSSNLDKYTKKNKEYNILYIDYNDKNLYKYRELLVKNNIPSFILFPNFSNQVELQKKIEKKYNMDGNVDVRLPMLIKMKNDKFTSIEKNITLENFIKKCK